MVIDTAYIISPLEQFLPIGQACKSEYMLTDNTTCSLPVPYGNHFILGYDNTMEEKIDVY